MPANVILCIPVKYFGVFSFGAGGELCKLEIANETRCSRYDLAEDRSLTFPFFLITLSYVVNSM